MAILKILTLNVGSATLKYTLFETSSETILASDTVDAEGADALVLAAEHAVTTCLPLGVEALGHRLVHGGSAFTAPTLITPEVLATLRGLQPLDPLHNPTEVAVIEVGLRLLPDVPAVAVFDTAFHQTLPEVAWRYALPRTLSDSLHLRRYGFHGLSYQAVVECLPSYPRLIACHLGSGASVCAIKDGKSVETSMGFTPLEGLVMGTRAGDLDPGLLLYLLRTQNLTPDTLETLLNQQSGLLGLSGISGDVRVLEQAAQSGDASAELALESFAYRVSKYIGAYAVVLEGVDAIAFTGGIGEHSARMRERICRRLAFLGVHLDSSRNAEGNLCISSESATVQAWVVPTDEARQLAQQTLAALT